MSLRSKDFSTGDVRGIILDFENAGDILPMHSHGEDDVHITIVARGAVRVSGPAIETAEHQAGAILDATAGIVHEFVALEDKTRIVNIIKKARQA